MLYRATQLIAQILRRFGTQYCRSCPQNVKFVAMGRMLVLGALLLLCSPYSKAIVQGIPDSGNQYSSVSGRS
jgi:hypothetical protein